MAYDATVAIPILLVPSIGGKPAVWVYISGDARTTVEGSGYFADAGDRGMKVGDVVFVIYTTGYVATIHAVSAVSSGAATISAAVLS